MGALSFKARFVPKVVAGLKRKKGGKRQSIRNFRKRTLKVGETVYLYYAMRTKQCCKLGEDVIKKVQVIRIDKRKVIIYDRGISNLDIKVNRRYVSNKDLNRFSRADGFKDFEDMKTFFVLPYIGNLYKW